MDSIGEKIVQAMVDALNAGASKPGTCYRNRQDAFAQAELPAFALYAVEEKVQRASGETSLRTRTVALECLVAGQPPQDKATDPLFSYAVQTLFADPTLAGLMSYLDQTHAIWQTEPGEEDASIARIDFDVQYTTLAADPTQAVT